MPLPQDASCECGLVLHQVTHVSHVNPSHLHHCPGRAEEATGTFAVWLSLGTRPGHVLLISKGCRGSIARVAVKSALQCIASFPPQLATVRATTPSIPPAPYNN
jgi:hypothetical protein